MIYALTVIPMEILIKMNMFLSFLSNLNEMAKPNSKSKTAPNKIYNPIEKAAIKLRK